MNDPDRQDDLDRLWQTQETPKMDISFDSIMTDASRFQRGVRNRNAREYVASVPVLVFFGWLAVSPSQSLLARIACVLMVMGAVVMVTNLRLRGHAAEVPPPSVSTREMLSWHRRELTRQRDLLKRVPVWYVAPILPGTALLLVAAMMHAQRPLVVVGVAVVVGAILASILAFNRHGARKLDEKLAALPQDDDVA